MGPGEAECDGGGVGGWARGGHGGGDGQGVGGASAAPRVQALVAPPPAAEVSAAFGSTHCSAPNLLLAHPLSTGGGGGGRGDEDKRIMVEVRVMVMVWLL